MSESPGIGEFYASFGGGPARNWNEARKYGFISAGGGSWYSRTMGLLSCSDRVWVKIPGTGYVGVGRVTEVVQPVIDFMLPTPQGERPCLDILATADYLRRNADDPDKAEHFVRVEWLMRFPKRCLRRGRTLRQPNRCLSANDPKMASHRRTIKEAFPKLGCSRRHFQGVNRSKENQF